MAKILLIYEWSECSVSCGPGGTRQRTQVCDGGSCSLGLVRVATESCNAPASCFVIVQNNSTMDLEIVIKFSKEEEDKDNIVNAISAAIEEVFSKMQSNVLNLSVEESLQPEIRKTFLRSLPKYFFGT